MAFTSITLRWRIWIACFAVLVNALAPSISHALAASRGEPGWEICRSGGPGAKPVSPALLAAIAQASLEQGSTRLDAALADCGYCLPHAGTYLILPDLPAMPAALPGHALRAVLVYHAPAPQLWRLAAPPRGPPAIT